MASQRRPWQDELATIDSVMKAISGVTDPEELVSIYWDGVGDFVPSDDYISLSRRGVEPPDYLITRSSRFTEHLNPWEYRDRLPRLRGGLLGEIAYANAPVVIDDLPARLAADDPGHFYLEGFKSLVALPIYENGQGLNVSVLLLSPGMDLDHSMIPMLHWQAGLFGRGTHNLVLRNQLAAALAALDRELQAVGDIQRSLLPGDLPDIPGIEVAAHYRASARAGGDYYDFFRLSADRWGVLIADVSGHGTPAAVLMGIVHAVAHDRPSAQQRPADLLGHLNDRLIRSYTQNGAFVTAFYGVLDTAAGTLTYSSAGHPPPRLVREDTVTAVDGAGGLPLGVLPDQQYRDATLPIHRGDLLVLYTDGITEAMGARTPSGGRPLFGVRRLDELLLACRPGPAAQCIERIRAAVADFSGGAPPTDDETLVALRCL